MKKLYRTTYKTIAFLLFCTSTLLLILGGEGTISSGGVDLAYRKGDSIFITAGSGKWQIRGSCDALLTTVPARHAKNS